MSHVWLFKIDVNYCLRPYYIDMKRDTEVNHLLIHNVSLTLCVQLKPGVPVYLAPWAACPPGGEAASGQLAPRGWRYPRVSCPPPWAACPPGVKLPLGSLPPGGEDTLSWAACPPPQENLTELNAERFYFLKNKNPYNRNMGKLIFICVCICIFFLIGGNWGPEYSGLRSLHLCQKSWQTPF